jgi:hypothetical protein
VRTDPVHDRACRSECAAQMLRRHVRSRPHSYPLQHGGVASLCRAERPGRPRAGRGGAARARIRLRHDHAPSYRASRNGAARACRGVARAGCTAVGRRDAELSRGARRASSAPASLASRSSCRTTWAPCSRCVAAACSSARRHRSLTELAAVCAAGSAVPRLRKCSPLHPTRCCVQLARIPEPQLRGVWRCFSCTRAAATTTTASGCVPSGAAALRRTRTLMRRPLRACRPTGQVVMPCYAARMRCARPARC